MILQLSPRETQLLARLRTRKRCSTPYLGAYLYEEELSSGTMTARRASSCVTSLLFTLNAKLEKTKQGRIQRVSPRGRSHVGIYQLIRR